MTKTTYQQIRELASLLSRNIPLLKTKTAHDQTAIYLNQIRECAYTDVNSTLTPEKFALNFRGKKMRQWLYENYNHAIFEEKNTSALHILVRLGDTEGIRKLASNGYNFNKIEKASSLGCIDLLTGMIGDNRSRVFHVQQKERLEKKDSSALFIELCRHGAIIDITTAVHILTDKKCIHLEAQACSFFYKQHFCTEIESLMKKVAKLENTYSVIHAFNQQMMAKIFKKIIFDKDHPLLKNYNKAQLEAIKETVVRRFTAVMHTKEYIDREWQVCGSEYATT